MLIKNYLIKNYLQIQEKEWLELEMAKQLDLDDSLKDLRNEFHYPKSATLPQSYLIYGIFSNPNTTNFFKNATKSPSSSPMQFKKMLIRYF